MRTRRILAHCATVLGAVMILLGLISLLSLPQAETPNQFIGLSMFIVAGLAIGYNIFIKGLDYIQLGHVMDKASEAVTKLTIKLEHDEDVSKHIKINSLMPYNIMLPDMKNRLDEQQNIIDNLYSLRKKVLTEEEHKALEVVEQYHYKRAGELQRNIQRIEERMKDNAGDVRG